MATLAEQGHWYPTMETSIIITMLLLWSLYGLSGARLISKLPLLRSGLFIIASIYLLRSIAAFSHLKMFPDNSLTFWLVSSGISFSIDLCYAIGTYQEWKNLKRIRI